MYNNYFALFIIWRIQKGAWYHFVSPHTSIRSQWLVTPLRYHIIHSNPPLNVAYRFFMAATVLLTPKLLAAKNKFSPSNTYFFNIFASKCLDEVRALISSTKLAILCVTIQKRQLI